MDRATGQRATETRRRLVAIHWSPAQQAAARTATYNRAALAPTVCAH